MKHLVISIFLGFFLVSVAFADWSKDFDVNLEKQGIEVAIEKALEEGTPPADIVNRGTKIEGLNPQNILKSLYCAGAAGDDIKEAADGAGISELILLAAFDKSVAECGDAVADSQAYTPAAAARVSFVGQPAPNPSPRPASVATF